MIDTVRARRNGLLAGLASFAMWGFFPLYFILLERVGATEILIHRVLWASVVMGCVITFRREWLSLLQVMLTRRLRSGLGLAALLIGVVWFFYGYGALTGRAVDVALGYFICPLVTVVLAVVIEREQLRTAQWISAAIGASAVVVVTVGYGRFPWISCVIAIAFGLYGLVKRRVGKEVTAAVGLTVESAFLLPIVGIVMVWMYATGRATFLVGAPGPTEVWLVLSGPLSVLPLLLFALAAARLPLSTVGNLQYLNPALQFCAGVLILQEEMPGARWLGFGLIWLALLVLVLDASLRTKRAKALS